MSEQLKGINTTTKRNKKTGRIKKYYYHRETGIRLDGEPGSPKFSASYTAAEHRVPQTRSAAQVKHLIKLYLCSDEFSLLRRSTQTEYKRMLGRMEPKFGNMPIAALDDPRVKNDLVDHQHARAKTSGKREADHELSAFSAMLTWASDKKHIITNHLKGFKRLYHSDRSDIVWLPEHIDAFMAAAEIDMQRAMILGLHSGQREGDIRKMPWISYDGHRLKFRQSKSESQTKRRRGRLINLDCTKALKEMLDGIERFSPFILTSKTGKQFTKRYFNRRWDDTMKKAGLEKVMLPDQVEPVKLHFNDLRGTTVTLLAEAGCTVPEIASITGHSLKTVYSILEKYLSRTKGLTTKAIANFEKSAHTKFARDLRVNVSRKQSL